MVLPRVGAFVRKLREAAFPSRAGAVENVLMALLIGAGVFLRMRGMIFGAPIGLWNDEASWAMRLYERPLGDHLIRPPGYTGLTLLSVKIFGNTELALRALPWLAGLATPFVAFFLARRVLRTSAARLLLVAVISFSSSGIDFSKEFKPYGIGILLHLLLPLLALRSIESQRTRDLLVFGVEAPVAVLFCQDSMFLYPGLFLVLAFEAWRRQNTKRLLVVFGFGAATAALVAGMYFGFWKRIPKERTEQYWADKYQVFHRPKEPSQSYATWIAEKYPAMVAMPGDRRHVWRKDGAWAKTRVPWQKTDVFIWLVLHIAAIASILQRRLWSAALLFWSPLLVCILFNFLGFWPIGAFRTNQFIIAGTSVLAAIGIDHEVRPRFIWPQLLPAFVIVFLPLLFFERTWNSKKQHIRQGGMMELLADLSARRNHDGAPDPLYLDLHSCQPFRFYTQYHPRGIRLWRDLQPHVTPVCDRNPRVLYRAARKLEPGSRAWFITTNPRTFKRFARKFEVRYRNRVHVHTLFETNTPGGPARSN